MPQTQLTLLAIIGGGLVLGWILALWLESRYNRDLKGGSDEILDEMEMVLAPRRGIEIRTRCKQLPGIFARIASRADGGFGERQARLLAKRISRRGRQSCQSVRFFIRMNGYRSDLEIQWTRDSSDRVRLLVFAPPSVIRALKRPARSVVPIPGTPEQTTI